MNKELLYKIVSSFVVLLGFVLLVFTLVTGNKNAKIKRENTKVIYTINQVFEPLKDAEVTVIANREDEWSRDEGTSITVGEIPIHIPNIVYYTDYYATVKFYDDYTMEVSTRKLEEIGAKIKASRNTKVKIDTVETHEENKKNRNYTVNYNLYKSKESSFKELEGHEIPLNDFLNLITKEKGE